MKCQARDDIFGRLSLPEIPLLTPHRLGTIRTRSNSQRKEILRTDMQNRVQSSRKMANDHRQQVAQGVLHHTSTATVLRQRGLCTHHVVVGLTTVVASMVKLGHAAQQQNTSKARTRVLTPATQLCTELAQSPFRKLRQLL